MRQEYDKRGSTDFMDRSGTDFVDRRVIPHDLKLLTQGEASRTAGRRLVWGIVITAAIVFGLLVAFRGGFHG